MEMTDTLRKQKVWGWSVATYLFLAGMGAGAYLMGFILGLVNSEFALFSKIAIILAAPLMVIGLFLLVLDLGQKQIFAMVFLRPLSSWMARGSIIITIFLILDIIHIGLWIWPFNILADNAGAFLALGIIGSIFAVLTMIYTGLLLGAAKPIPFWSQTVLPVLFLVSGISTGIMGTAFILTIFGLSAGTAVEPALVRLARYDVFIVIVEAIILVVYLYRMYQLAEARLSANMVVTGNLSARFWGGVVVSGLLVPFVFELYVGYLSSAATVTMLIPTAIVSVIGLFGGLMLRHIIVAGGTRTTLNIDGVLLPVSDTYITY